MIDRHQDRQGRPAVVVPPPLIYAVPFVTGLILQWVFPIRFLALPFRVMLGLVCLVPAIMLFVAGRLAFRRSQTSMLPTSQARTLMTSGPFRHTRNPLYLGLLLAYAGVSLVFGLSWSLIFLPVVVVGLQYLAVLREERVLERQFGDEYRRYRASVRRWF